MASPSRTEPRESDPVQTPLIVVDSELLDHRNQAQSLPRSHRSMTASNPGPSPSFRLSSGTQNSPRLIDRSLLDTEASEHHDTLSNEFAVEDDLQFGLDDLDSNKAADTMIARPRTGSYLDTVLTAPLRSPRVTYSTPAVPPNLTLDSRTRTLSNASTRPLPTSARLRRPSGPDGDKGDEQSSIDAPSHPDSQDGEDEEAEQDVCFPMSEEFRSAEGIDFEELDAFVLENDNFLTRHLSQRTSATSRDGKAVEINEKVLRDSSSTSDSFAKPDVLDNSTSSTTRRDYSSRFASPAILPISSQQFSVPDLLHSTQRISHAQTLTTSHLRQMEKGQNAPDRFSFFTSERDDTIHAPDLGGLLDSSKSFKKLFRQDRGCWWLDVMCPTDAEMKLLAKAFGIHPLTSEDIRVQEAREKVELFKSYYFVCFKSFDHDKDSQEFLEPVNIYIVVFKEGLLSFHFAPTSHPANVRRRIRQLRDYVSVSADWISYAIIDDVTDVFMPLIHEIELETDSIEDAVMITRETDTGVMLQRIGECRKKVMALYRLLHGKADVIKMFAKRCNEQWDVAPKGEIGLYLGDIQDHLVTMTSSLTQFEKILSRSHSNYLAQLSIYSMESNNRLNAVLGKITFIATMLVPMNLLTGLFGMNVKIPFGGGPNLYPFFTIVGFIVITMICAGIFAKRSRLL